MEMTTATITPTSAWCRAMQRAICEHVKPTRQTDGSFRVPSVSTPGVVHIVSVNEAGHIIHCDCTGWQHGGRSHPCKHAASVAMAIMFMKGAHIVPSTSEPMPASVPSPTRSRSQIFRTAR